MTKDVLITGWVVLLAVWVVGAVVLRSRGDRKAATLWIGLGAAVLWGLSALIG